MLKQDAYISVKVKSVSDFEEKLTSWRKANNGILISARQSSNDGVQTGYVTIRISNKDFSKLEEFVSKHSIKITDMAVYGQDILNSYNDSMERLKILRKTKSRIEELTDKTDDVDKLMSLQNNLLRIEQQIASLQRETQNAQINSKTVVVYLSISTDEAYLPYYKQSNKWQPKVVIKKAWASVRITLQWIANFILWAIVFAVIWGPVVVVGYVIYKGQKKAKK